LSAPGPAPQSSLADWLVLTAAPGVGPRTAARLIERFGDPRAVIEAASGSLVELGLSTDAIAWLRNPDQARLHEVLEWAGQPDCCVVPFGDPLYPPQLAQIADPPVLLYVRGDPGVLAEPHIAIVGSRNPSPQGLSVARELASRLASWGLVVVSGLAVGIDGAAHEGALETGRTVAVLGTGPDLVYPAVHRELARRIAAAGALASELPPGVGPLGRNFPRRNRIVSGLALGTLVVEATLQSGSLITARQALEQGREVFAVPGSVRSPLSRGCHALIREGARLVEDAEQVLEDLATQLRGLIAAPTQTLAQAPGDSTPLESGGIAGGQGLDPDYRRLLDAMGFDPVAPDELVGLTGLPVASLSSMLLVLELDGHVSSCPGGRYCRTRA
jgi:DNA processing protein